MIVAGRAVGGAEPLLVIAGPCVIESESFVLATAERIRAVAARVGLPLIFKASFDKANRSSLASFRGPGLEEGLRILERVRRELDLPVLTDVHDEKSLPAVAQVADVLQTPALLCRQTDFIVAVASQGRPVNLKKGQFLAPQDMTNVVAKARSTGNGAIMVCERGTSFGYHDLVADMRSIPILRTTGCPVIFDCSHAVQRPGAHGDRSGGAPEHIPVLARAAVAAGVAGVFVETHPDPARARSDADNAWPLERLGALLEMLKAVDETVKSRPFLEDELTGASAAEMGPARRSLPE
ncbi:MAG TPA: 3-deoxy-8-phosphooctulonate synthase [Gammaproteobacteria bacterium]